MSTGGGPLWVGSAQHEGTKKTLRHGLDGRVWRSSRTSASRRESGSITLSTPQAKVRCQMRRSFPKGWKVRRAKQQGGVGRSSSSHARERIFVPLQGGAMERRNGEAKSNRRFWGITVAKKHSDGAGGQQWPWQVLCVLEFDESIAKERQKEAAAPSRKRSCVCEEDFLVALEWNVVVCGVPSSKLARKRWKCVGFLCGWVVGRRPHHATRHRRGCKPQRT